MIFPATVNVFSPLTWRFKRMIARLHHLIGVVVMLLMRHLTQLKCIWSLTAISWVNESTLQPYMTQDYYVIGNSWSGRLQNLLRPLCACLERRWFSSTNLIQTIWFTSSNVRRSLSVHLSRIFKWFGYLQLWSKTIQSNVKEVFATWQLHTKSLRSTNTE